MHVMKQRGYNYFENTSLKKVIAQNKEDKAFKVSFQSEVVTEVAPEPDLIQ